MADYSDISLFWFQLRGEEFDKEGTQIINQLISSISQAHLLSQVAFRLMSFDSKKAMKRFHLDLFTDTNSETRDTQKQCEKSFRGGILGV